MFFLDELQSENVVEAHSEMRCKANTTATRNKVQTILGNEAALEGCESRLL